MTRELRKALHDLGEAIFDVAFESDDLELMFRAHKLASDTRMPA